MVLLDEMRSFVIQGFEDVRPPNAKDVPLPQNLINIDSTKRFIRREFGTPWVGRTPCKNKHVHKAMDALKEIVDDSDKLATAGKRKTAANSNSDEGRKKETTGIELICKIMADRPLREETQRSHPQLYEEMLSIMLENISFSQI